VKSDNYDVTFNYTKDAKPWHVAANRAIQYARDAHADWLMMVENDQSYMLNPLDVLDHVTDQKIITLPSLVLFDNVPCSCIQGAVYEDRGDFIRVQAGSCGTLFLHHTVWETMPGPWFKLQMKPGAESGELLTSHDCGFFQEVQEQGFAVWTHREHWLKHYHTAELAALALTTGKPLPTMYDRVKAGTNFKYVDTL
jgi:hypothetical protein